MTRERQEMSAWGPESLPRVSDRWLLRNDGRNIVAYTSTVEKDQEFRVLSQAEAAVIGIFDGSHTLAEIEDAFKAIFRGVFSTEEEMSDYFEEMSRNLLATSDFIAPAGEPSHSVRTQKASLIPDFASYHFPVKRLERPIVVTLGFTNRCLCDCVYCYAERSPSREYGLERWKEVFDEISANRINLVDIGGGDVFRRRDVFSIFEEMTLREFTFFVSTKSYISRYDAERMYEMGIGRYDIPRRMIRPVQVSVDSADPEQADMMVRSSGHLQRAFETVSNLVQAGISPRVKAVITAQNAEAIEGVVRLFSRIGTTKFHFVQYHRSQFNHDDRLFLSYEQKLKIRETAERLRSLFPDLELNIQEDLTTGGSKNVSWEEWRKRPICSSGRSKMLARPDGDVILCEQAPHDERFIVGNIFEEGVLGVWNSRRTIDFVFPKRENFRDTVCYDCGDFDSCNGFRGYCFRDSFCSYGTLYDAQPECPRQTKTPVRCI
jgi:radical SAM protein with 4Fe4S-binding SPASM domain